MNRLVPTIAAYLFATTASFAVGPVYENSALGFEIRTFPQDEKIMICSQQNCLTFLPSDGGKTYTEESGKCTLTMEHFRKDFATGDTANEYMLTVAVQVVKVIKGEDACQLEQQSPKQMRSLTGIYGA